jgi:hypothetical protein
VKRDGAVSIPGCRCDSPADGVHDQDCPLTMREVFVIEEDGEPETPSRIYLKRSTAQASLKLRAKHGPIKGLRVVRYVPAPEEQ